MKLEACHQNPLFFCMPLYFRLTAMLRPPAGSPQCEDELLQALALSVMPLEELHAEAASELALNAGLGQALALAHEDLLVQKLLAWWVRHDGCVGGGGAEA